MKYSTQRGSVLLISLMILIVLTLLTFTAAKNVLLQEKMVASTRDSMLALEVAEAALLDAEARAFGITYSDDGSTGAYQECGLVAGAACWMDTFKSYDNLFEDGVWTNAVTSNRTISCGTSDANCNLAGEFIIMDLGTIDITISEGINVDTGGAAAGSGSSGVKKFRIIARGAGLNSDVQRVIVSYYASEV